MSENLNDFVVAEARPVPLILLLDTSGSMSGQKIATLNTAIRELVQDLAANETPQGEVHLGIIEFNGEVTVRPPQAISVFTPHEMQATGQTMMARAIDAARLMIEDRTLVPTRAYAPTIALVSDGQPSDDVGPAMDRLHASVRAGRATRVALAIGDDADIETLRRFVNNPEWPVIRAHEVAKIRNFFRWVSLSVQTRSKSRDPDRPAVAPLVNFSEDDILF
jgi:uncharacterized protein YegL